MNRERINDYDLGRPLLLAPFEERRQRVPAAIWARVERVEASLASLLGARLHEVRLFGSYARGEFTSESDIDLLIRVDRLEAGDREAIVAATFDAGGLLVSPPHSHHRRNGRSSCP